MGEFMKLIPLIDQTGAVRVWAEQDSSWLFHLTGDAFGLVSFNGVFRRTGVQIGWWYGDHIRDRFGRVVLARPGTKIEGLDVRRPKRIPQPPALRLPTGRPALRWLLPPTVKAHQWAVFRSLFDSLARLRAWEEQVRAAKRLGSA